MPPWRCAICLRRKQNEPRRHIDNQRVCNLCYCAHRSARKRAGTLTVTKTRVFQKTNGQRCGRGLFATAILKKNERITYFGGRLVFEPVFGEYVVVVVKNKVWLDATPLQGPGCRFRPSHSGAFANQAPNKRMGNARIAVYQRWPYMCSLVATRVIRRHEEILVDTYGEQYPRLVKSGLREAPRA